MTCFFLEEFIRSSWFRLPWPWASPWPWLWPWLWSWPGPGPAPGPWLARLPFLPGDVFAWCKRKGKGESTTKTVNYEREHLSKWGGNLPDMERGHHLRRNHRGRCDCRAQKVERLHPQPFLAVVRACRLIIDIQAKKTNSVGPFFTRQKHNFFQFSFSSAKHISLTCCVVGHKTRYFSLKQNILSCGSFGILFS